MSVVDAQLSKLKNAFQPELRDKVKKGLAEKYLEQKKQGDNAAKSSKLEELANKMQWKAEKAKYKDARNQTIGDLVKVYQKNWEDETKAKANVRDQNGNEEDVKKVEDEYKEKLEKELEDTFNQKLFEKLKDYQEAALKLRGKKIDFDAEKKYVMNQAKKRFAKLKNATMSLIKKTYLDSQNQFDASKILDKANMELSNLPLKLDEQVTMVKNTLDTLLGKVNVDPTSPSFDVDILLKQIEAVLNPVLTASFPLQAVGGSIPIIGELGGLISMLAAQNKPSTPLSPDDILKLCPKPPSLPVDWKEKLEGIYDNITTMCMVFPLVLINLLFAIVNVIWSKLKIITSIIPLGGMFPLNLIPQAIAAMPKIMTMTMTLPTQIRQMVMGIITKKLQECAALAFPQPNIDPSMLRSLIKDVEENRPVKEVSTKVKRNFSTVSKEFWEAEGKPKGFSENQIKQIQKNYKSIYDASNLPIKTFEDSGGQGAGLAGVAAGGGGETSDSNKGYKEGSDITRSEPTVDDYEKFLNEEIKKTMKDGELRYPHLYKTQDLMGEYFKMLKVQLAELGNEVVLYDKMTPALGTPAPGSVKDENPK